MDSMNKTSKKIGNRWIIGGIIGLFLYLLLLQNKLLYESLLGPSFVLTSISVLIIYSISNVIILPDSLCITIIDVILGSVPFVLCGVFLMLPKLVFKKYFWVICAISILLGGISGIFLLLLGISYGILPFGIEGSGIGSEEAQLISPYFIFSGMILVFSSIMIIIRYLILRGKSEK